MAGYVIEPQRRLAIRDRYDVIVVGGGIAGVAAAVAAAREGAKTCLIEKEYALGGLATLGNIIIYLPLCDGMGHKVSGGLAEALLKLSVCDGSQDSTSGGRDIPDCWKHPAPPEQRPGEALYHRLQSRHLCAWRWNNWSSDTALNCSMTRASAASTNAATASTPSSSRIRAAALHCRARRSSMPPAMPMCAWRPVKPSPTAM